MANVCTVLQTSRTRNLAVVPLRSTPDAPKIAQVTQTNRDFSIPNGANLSVFFAENGTRIGAITHR